MNGLGITTYVRAQGEEANALKDGYGARPRRWVVERNPGWLNRYRRFFGALGEKNRNCIAMLYFVLRLIAYRQSGLFE